MSATCQQFASRWPSSSDRRIAYGVCEAESHGDPNAHCLNCFPGVTEDSRGLGQVNVIGNPQFAGWDLYDVATRNRLATLTDPGGYSSAPLAVFSPDATVLAVLDNSHIYLWNPPRPPSAP